MFENPVKVKLAAGKAAWGASASCADELANQICISTGIDFLWIDTEHSSFGIDDIGTVPVLARRAECVPMIRVTALDQALIKKALDAGASAVMIPQVNNADEARAAVRYAKYPPQGSRGVSPMWTFYMGVDWGEYLPRANDEILVVAQVESPEGIENLEAIAGVEGVDVVFAGPADLAAALGVIGQTKHPRVREFLAGFPSRVAACGKTPGIAVSSAEEAADAYRMGYRFIDMGSLLFSGARGISDGLKTLRALE